MYTTSHHISAIAPDLLSHSFVETNMLKRLLRRWSTGGITLSGQTKNDHYVKTWRNFRQINVCVFRDVVVCFIFVYYLEWALCRFQHLRSYSGVAHVSPHDRFLQCCLSGHDTPSHFEGTGRHVVVHCVNAKREAGRHNF